MDVGGGIEQRAMMHARDALAPTSANWEAQPKRPSNIVAVLASALLFISDYQLLASATPVPVGPFTEHDAREIRGRLDDIKENLRVIQSAKLFDINEKLNGVVLSLSQIDSNVKGLQERAHVWDTFQLHVSAWNDQIKAVDKKLDLLSRRSTITGSSPELDKRLSDVIFKLETFADRLEKKHDTFPDDPLVAEFAAKGVMTTLKALDGKVDTLVTTASEDEEKRKQVALDREAENKILVATMVEELLETGACVAMTSSKQGSAVVATGGDGAENTAVSKKEGDEEEDPAQMPKNVRRLLEIVGDLRSDFMNHLEEEDRHRTVTRDEENAKAGMKLLATEVETMAKEVSGLKETLTGSGSNLSPLGGKQQQNCLSSWNEVEKKAKFKFSTIATQVEETHRCCFDQAHRFKGFQATTEFKLGQLDEVLRTHEFNDERRLGLIQDHYTRQMSELLNRVDKMSLRLDKTCVVPSGSLASIRPLLKPTSKTDQGENDAGKQENPRDSPRTQDADIKADASSNRREGCASRKYAGETSGVIYIPHEEPMEDPFFNYYIRYCDQETNGGGWTVILRRDDYGMPRQNFSQPWDVYSKGFGNIEKDFWFGTEQIHRLTSEEPHVLRVELEDFEGNWAFAEYSTFQVLNSTTNYTLIVTDYFGNATDSFGAHNGSQFSTYDRIHDGAPPCCPCSPAYGYSGWWFYSCFESNLTGPYLAAGDDNKHFQGIIWEHFKGNYSLKRAEMKIRPKTFASNHRGDVQALPEASEPWWSSIPTAEDP